MKEDLKRFQHHKGVGPVAAQLIDKLKGGEPGDTLTDIELKEVCGHDTRPKGKGYSSLGTAIRFCIREHGILWSRIRGANAIKCLDPERKIEFVAATNKHVARVTRRGVNILGSIEVKELPEEKRPDYFAALAQTGTLAEISRANTRKKLEAHGITKPFDMQKMLEAMSE